MTERDLQERWHAMLTGIRRASGEPDPDPSARLVELRRAAS